MQQLLQAILAKLARAIINRQRPKVVAVTGSVGKTSTRNAIAVALDGTFRLRASKGNYNNELGVPLSIIGAESPGSSPFGWLRVLWRGARLALSRDASYPELLVLEYAMDRPGDIAYLCDIARPDVGILTAISPVHAEYFDSIDQMAKEKGEVLRRVPEDGLAVANADDERVLAQADGLLVETVTYGFDPSAGMRGTSFRLEARFDDNYQPGESAGAISFALEHDGNRVPVRIPGVVSKAQAISALAAAAAATHLGVSLPEVAKRLADLKADPGRMSPIPGIKGSLILDDSYNAAPASVRSALDTLAAFEPIEGARRVAVLGHMAELGKYSEEEHAAIGRHVAESGVDLLVTVGEIAMAIREAAIEAGMTDGQCAHVADSKEAGRHMDAEVRRGDIVLVKGSQSARMEKVVKDLMAEPLRAKELLVRQYGKWLES